MKVELRIWGLFLNYSSKVISLVNNSRIFHLCIFVCTLAIVSPPTFAATCGKPQIVPGDTAALYIWQECGTQNWHIRATAGGNYSNFAGRIFTDGSIPSATPLWLGAADSFAASNNDINFNFQTWNNNEDGIDFSVSKSSSVYLNISKASENNILLGLNKEPVKTFPIRIGGDGKRYNFVFILTDDQRSDTLWAMPNVQKDLVDKGVLFENSLVASPLCCPARASILSGGLFDKDTGVYSNNPVTGTFGKFDDKHNLGTALQAAGYRTALIGKVMNEYPVGYVMPGWDKLVANLGPARDNWNSFNVTVGSSGATATNGNIVHINQYVTDYQSQQVLDFISQTSSKPFFVILSTYAPHAPATAASSDVALFPDYVYSSPGTQETDLSDKPLYVRDPSIAKMLKYPPFPGFPAQQLRSLQAVDRAVAAIVDKLTALNEINNTVIVYTSDNGFMWGEHGLWRKTMEFEESLRVPLVIRYPGIAPRTEPAQVAADLDISATALDNAGSDFRTDGFSLTPLLHQLISSYRDKLLVNIYDTQNIHQTWAGIRTNQWKYVERADGDEELYDLANDPYELDNRPNDPAFATIKQTLKSYLDKVKGLAITKLPNPHLVVNQQAKVQLEAWGGTPPYTWKQEDLTPEIFLGKNRWSINDVNLPLPLIDDYTGCGSPALSPASERVFIIWNECNSNRWHVRASAGGDYAKFSGNITADAGFSSVAPYLLDSADVLDSAQPGNINFIMRIWNDNVNGVDFDVNNGSGLNLTVWGEPYHRILLGTNRFDITKNSWPKNVTDPVGCGKPTYDAATESALFIWKDCGTSTWHIRGTAGGQYTEFDGRIISNVALTNITPYNLNLTSASKSSRDILDTSNPTETDFTFYIWASGVNGFDFDVPGGANAVLDVDTHNLPAGLVLNGSKGTISGTPEKIARRTVRLTALDQSVRKIDGKPQSISMDMKIDVANP